MSKSLTKSLNFFALAGALLAGLPGCRFTGHRNPDLEAHLPPAHRIPNEEVKTTLPPYVIEPPDVLLIDAIKVVPKAPYRLEPLDIIRIDAENVLPDYPLEGNFQIEANPASPSSKKTRTLLTRHESFDESSAQLLARWPT